MNILTNLLFKNLNNNCILESNDNNLQLYYISSEINDEFIGLNNCTSVPFEYCLQLVRTSKKPYQIGDIVYDTQFETVCIAHKILEDCFLLEVVNYCDCKGIIESNNFIKI